jgi:hypothetical protein
LKRSENGPLGSYLKPLRDGSDGPLKSPFLPPLLSK